METTKQVKANFTDAKGQKFNLLTEWDFLPFDQIKYKLVVGFINYLEPKGTRINRRDIDSTFGFAYTSSGTYAGLWACNGYELQHDAEFNSFQGFVIGDDLQSYLIFDNETEKSILVPFIKFVYSEEERAIVETNELNKHTQRAMVETIEYLKQFQGKKILTNSGLSKKIDLPTFQVREKTKYGIIFGQFFLRSP